MAEPLLRTMHSLQTLHQSASMVFIAAMPKVQKRVNVIAKTGVCVTAPQWEWVRATKKEHIHLCMDTTLIT